MAERTVATTAAPGTEVMPSEAEDTRTQERYITPPVDIYETSEGLFVLVDMAGVAQQDLHVQVDNHALAIRGTAHHLASGSAVHREYQLLNYYRQFQLSEKVDETKIRAELKHGVLMIALPKAEEAKPRQIAVQVG